MDILSGSVAKLLDYLNFGFFGSEGTVENSFFGVSEQTEKVTGIPGSKMTIVTTVWPTELSECILVRPTGGGDPPRDTTSRPTISIQIRSQYMDLAENKLRILHEKLKVLENFWLADHLYCYNIIDLNEPGFISQDDKGNFIFGANYILRVKFN